MKGFVQGTDRQQATALPECLDDWVDESNLVRAVDVFVKALEVTALTHNEAVKAGVTVGTQLAGELPCIQYDRVQLRQVMLNFIVIAIQSMSGVEDGNRELHISTVRRTRPCVGAREQLSALGSRRIAARFLLRDGASRILDLMAVGNLHVSVQRGHSLASVGPVHEKLRRRMIPSYPQPRRAGRGRALGT
jgi:hypothetical protein